MTVSNRSILLAGWDEADIDFFQEEIIELSRREKVYSMPYSTYLSNCILPEEIVQLASISECEYRSKYHICDIREPLVSRITGAQYEMLLILLARTTYVSLPLYEKIRHMSGLLNYFYDYLSQYRFLTGSVLIYRVIPHLYSDYCLALAASLHGCTSYVISPLKGVTSLLRADQTSSQIYYYIHELFEGKVAILPKARQERVDIISAMLSNLFQGDGSNAHAEQVPTQNIEPYPLRAKSLENLRRIRKNEKDIVCSGEFFPELNMLSELKRVYESQCSTHYLSQGTKKYVYFPLPKQPEASTQPFSGVYWDPVYWIDRLHIVFGDKVDIVVKEHPDTFRFPFEPNKHFLTHHNFPRTVSLYNSLRERHHNLYFVPTSLSSEQVFRSPRCVGVFTMNGAALYQCIRDRITVYMPKSHWGTMITGVKTLQESEISPDNKEEAILAQPDLLSSSILKISQRVIRTLPSSKHSTKEQFVEDIIYLLNS